MNTPGQRFRQAVSTEQPLQVVGAVNAYAAILAEHAGFQALYLSGGGVAACSCGVPDLGITTLEDVLIDVRRITDASSLPLLVDIDTGWGGAFNIARAIKSLEKAGAAAVHIEDQVQQKRCGHRPNKAIVSQSEMVDRIRAAVDARIDENFVIMARTDALAVEGLDAAIERAVACVEAGADMLCLTLQRLINLLPPRQQRQFNAFKPAVELLRRPIHLTCTLLKFRQPRGKRRSTPLRLLFWGQRTLIPRHMICAIGLIIVSAVNTETRVRLIWILLAKHHSVGIE